MTGATIAADGFEREVWGGCMSPLLFDSRAGIPGLALGLSQPAIPLQSSVALGLFLSFLAPKKRHKYFIANCLDIVI
jgi:hypothetical protein